MAKILESQAAWNVWGTACGLACLEWSDQRECNSYSLSNPSSTPVKYTSKIYSTSVRFSLLLVRSLNSSYCSLSLGPGLHLHSQHPPSIHPAYKSRSGLREKLFVNWIIFHHLFLPVITDTFVIWISSASHWSRHSVFPCPVDDGRGLVPCFRQWDVNGHDESNGFKWACTVCLALLCIYCLRSQKEKCMEKTC